MTMAQYRVEVTTGDYTNAGTADHIYITLFGTDGKSERTELDNAGVEDFQTGTTGIYIVKTGSSLGKILLVKVEKDPFFLYPEDEWYCSKIVVKTPEGEEILFPCYRWVSRRELVELRGGKAVKPFEEEHPLLAEHRKNELKFKKNLYQWAISDEELPHHSSFKHVGELPAEICSTSKGTEMLYKNGLIAGDVIYKELAVITDSWENIEDMKQIYWFKKTPITEYLIEHWQEDDFFGFQFLNAVNSNVIKKCSELPPNFPVKEEMVMPFLEKGSSLQKEMKKGNIFICDFKRLDGLPTNVYNGEHLQVAAGLCLLYLNPEGKMMPIAIQLKQQPSEENPIFLPSDSEADWLLAKIFIKNIDLMEQQAVYHYMSTHNLSEIFALSTHRNFPVIHPIYKLVIPHIRDTLQINTMGRNYIAGPYGLLSKSVLGHSGMMQLLKRAISEITYSSFCLPDSITERGLESIPNFYYRDDGLKLWNIINSFVKGTVEYYYPSDSDVCEDNELQAWVNDIFIHGILGNKASGFPESFSTVEEVIKFTTMLIFTVSGQHASVNNGMFDYQVWPPNGSLMLRKSPPTAKGSIMKTVLDTLPSVGQTANFAANVFVISDKYSDRIFLGDYPQQRFDEPVPKQMIKKFQAELASLSEEISTRNSKLALPYTFMNPAEVENSVTI